MSELKAEDVFDVYEESLHTADDTLVYRKSEADKVIAEKDAEIRRLKNDIAPKPSDKTIQERLNEVCEKHGVSTLQDLDWALCESEKRYTKNCIERQKEIYRLIRALYKACANWAWAEHVRYVDISDGSQGYKQVQERWEKMARKCQAKAKEYK